MAGSYRSAMIGNAGFFKVDYNLSPRQFVTFRVNTSRYNGENNVFLDPSSPVTTHALSENGVEDVATETANLALTGSFSPKVSSHLRLQFSRDLQNSAPNSNDVRFKIYGVLDGASRSSILPRTTREHKLHLADTINIEQKRHLWKFGADVSQAWIAIFNNWKLSSVTTIGCGRPMNAHVTGDTNRDGNDSNDRLPGVSRNSAIGPDYATTDFRLNRQLKATERWKLTLLVESFNAFNRNNQRVDTSDDGFQSAAANFVVQDTTVNNHRYPAQFRVSNGFLQPNNSYAPRQIQISPRVSY